MLNWLKQLTGCLLWTSFHITRWELCVKCVAQTGKAFVNEAVLQTPIRTFAKWWHTYLIDWVLGWLCWKTWTWKLLLTQDKSSAEDSVNLSNLIVSLHEITGCAHFIYAQWNSINLSPTMTKMWITLPISEAISKIVVEELNESAIRFSLDAQILQTSSERRHRYALGGKRYITRFF